MRGDVIPHDTQTNLQFIKTKRITFSNFTDYLKQNQKDCYELCEFYEGHIVSQLSINNLIINNQSLIKGTIKTCST